MAFKLMLLEWNFADYVDAFDEEGIDDESFNLLDEETVKKIFVKSGPRLKFKKYYEYFLKSNSKEASTLVAETQSTVSTDTISTGRVSVTDSDLESALENYTFQIEEYKGKRPLDQTQTDTNLPKKANIDITNIDTVFHEGLEALLKKNTEGNIILLNKNKLTNDQRQKLANIVINELIGVYGPELQQHTILKAAKEIGQIFTHETADAYMISSDDGGPKGKLWNRYHNIKKALHLANTVKKKELQSTAISSPDKLETTNLLDFLKVGTEPFIKVLDAWEQTYKLRRKLYLNSGLKEIYQDFPCLSLNRGIELIETDFNNRFAGKIDIIYTNWPKISQAILNEAKERKIKIFDDGNFADKNVHAIMCLVYLFQPITVKKNRKGGNWRPTRSEIMDSFFVRVEGPHIFISHLASSSASTGVSRAIQKRVQVKCRN